jgi:hypothetical protein
VPKGDDGPRLVSFSPSSLIPGTRLVLTGEKFRANEPMQLHFQGTVTDDAGGAPRRLDATLVPTIDSGTRLFADVNADLITAAGGAGRFTGTLQLEVTRAGQKLASTLTASLGLAGELTPKLTGASTTAIYVGDVITLRGADFLLGGHDDVLEGGHEGELEVIAAGDFHADDGTTDAIADYPLAVKATNREEALYVHTPEVFGLRTGEFRGTLTPRNKHKSGQIVTGAPLPVSVLVLASTIAAVSPLEASRQQRVKLGGHGFYASKRDGTVTLLRLKGQFTPKGGSRAPLEVELPVRVESADQLTWVLAPTVVEEQLTGFGAKAGVFTGTVAPVLQLGRDELAGQPWTGTFTVRPTKQVVLFSFTPQFTDALRLYGLRNVEEAVRARLFEVARRDYADFNLDFRAERPEDFEQFTTMEITGDDPNDSDLFGLDNTDGKDVGNLRLNDYVGGTNAEQVEAGSYAYGGVFLASFLRLSPNVCRKNENGIWNYKACKGGSSFPLKTERFDLVFKAFAPILGGTEARADELAGGARSAALKEAVRVLGGLAGNTAVHELGHSLGLAQEIGIDEFHNPGDTPGQIMNPGGARPFEERAELDGQGPAVWAPGDRAYLEETLAKP